MITFGEIDDVQRALIWLTGSIHRRSWNEFWPLLPWSLVFVPPALLLARDLNALNLGKDIARGLLRPGGDHPHNRRERAERRDYGAGWPKRLRQIDPAARPSAATCATRRGRVSRRHRRHDRRPGRAGQSAGCRRRGALRTGAPITPSSLGRAQSSPRHTRASGYMARKMCAAAC